MSEQLILISSVKTDRELDNDDVLQKLVLNIVKNGIQVPILVSTDMILIDGLRRLEAAKLLKEETLPAVIAETYEQAISNLTLARAEGGPFGPRRTWEVIRDIDELRKVRTAERRRTMMLGVPIAERTKAGRFPRSRDMISAALQDYNAEKYAYLYRRAEAGEVSALSLVPRVESGELTINGALGRYHQTSPKLRGDVRSLSEQRQLIRGATRSLSGLVKGLEKLGAPIKLPQDELSEALTSLRANRTILSSVIRLLQEELKTDD